MTDLTPEQRLALDIGYGLKRSKRFKRERDEDPFPVIARHICDQLRLSGWRFEHPKTEAVLEPRASVTLEEYRTLSADARAVQRMIREALEAYCPPGTVPAEETTEPTFAAEAEVLVNAILKLAADR